MSNPWDINALYRHNQVIAGKDITFSRLMAPKFVKILAEIPNAKDSELLEIGCGTGILTHVVSEYVERVVGFDSSSQACDIAKKYTENDKNVTILSDDLEGLNKNFINAFDIALAHMVFHTIENLHIAISNTATYLKSRGHLIFSIPHPCFFSFYKDEIAKAGYNYINQSRHNIIFTISNDHAPLPERVPYFHRPLSIYCNLLSELGFYIQNILEPYPSSELLAEYHSAWDYPRYMIFICRKIDNGG